MNLQKISNKELRHLNASEISQIAFIIDNNNNWIKILEAIPTDLNNISTNNLDGNYERKYKSGDADILRSAAQRVQRSPSFMLLFEEWATSGRQRPTIQHLYELLISLPLFRAADFIAEQILHIQRPNRPNNGPGKKIDITLPASGIDSKRMRDFLEAHRYPNNTNILENNSPYNISIDLPSSNLCSESTASTEVTEIDRETNEDNDTTRTHSSYTNRMSGYIDSSLIFEEVEVKLNIPDLSLLNILSC